MSLVQDFTNYNDEISYLIQILYSQLEFLRNLKLDVQSFESSQSPEQESADANAIPGTIARTDWAVAIVEVRLTSCRTLLAESRRAMDAVSFFIFLRATTVFFIDFAWNSCFNFDL